MFLYPNMERSHSDLDLGNVEVAETSRDRNGKAPLLGGVENSPAAEAGVGCKRRVAISDLIFRISAAAAALTATIIMGSAQQTLPFFTQLLQFVASYDDLPTSSYFVIALSLVTGYLVLSVPFSVVCIARPQVAGPRFLLIVFDTVSLAFAASAAASSAAIVYLAHNGNSAANWLTICRQFSDFCQKISGGVVASLIAVALLVLLLASSAIALKIHS
ncbi:casparian strip membrane protein 1-like [Andrographis paniculata]|uniref:casparian strip membrane protein 1-like n=1 Tax=Andrographis paniculata TaxID=175694 RepID=UPI0021E70059|nr:casparian strip membrane protein 1-like [Andrographis paniculata]